MRDLADAKRSFNDSVCGGGGGSGSGTAKKVRFSMRQSSERVIRRPCRSTVFDLPVEVSARIFECLSVRERRNVKLVCRRWCEIANSTRKLVEAEKLVCCDLYRCSDASHDILTTVGRSKREILHLELRYVEFGESDLWFWQQCGPKIRSLHFCECSLSPDTLLRAIEHCINLTSIAWSVENAKTEKAVVCSAATMDRLLSRQLTNANLASLSIRCNRANHLSNFVLDGLFALFPNVRKFAFRFAAFERYADEPSLAHSRNCLTLDCVLRRIRSLRDVAQHLDVSLKYKDDRSYVSWDRIVLASEFKQLTEVTLDVSVENVEPDTVYSFFAEQTRLQSVRLRANSGGLERFFDQLCSRLVDGCPKLRHLRIESRALWLSAVSLRKIVESPLATFCVRASKLDVDPQFSRPGHQPNEHPVNTRLRTLVLDAQVGESAQLAFVDTFRRLHTLELRAVTDRVLQSIWRYQMDLVSVTLSRAYYTTDYGFTGIRSDNVEMGDGGESSGSAYSARRLRNLEYLSIESAEQEWTISSDTLAEFVFPKLRYLLLDVYINGELHDALLSATSELKSLEVVSLKFVETPFRKCYDVCAKLTNLRYLCIRDDSEFARRFTDSQYQRLFKRRPSLRALIHDDHRSTNNAYYFDVVENKPKKKTIKRLHRLSSEKIGIFFVDCVWF